MQFGYFDDANREYVITTPQTPFPWINYLGTQDFFGLISHTGGGYCFYRDARLRRITRYRYNNVPPDSGGRYFTFMRRKICHPLAPVRPVWTFLNAVTAWLYKDPGLRTDQTEISSLSPWTGIARYTGSASQILRNPRLPKLFSLVEFCLGNALRYDNPANLNTAKWRWRRLLLPQDRVRERRTIMPLRVTPAGRF